LFDLFFLAKLKEGVSFDHILDSIRDTASTDSIQRTLLLDRQDLKNITRDFNISYATKKHNNDAISVQLWVKDMQKLETECPVIYYKGQDQDDIYLNKADFALIIMTNFQQRQLKKFGPGKICIDGTHGTNGYDIQLYTIMTVDEFGSGCPVTYCFSNRMDEPIFKLFFNKLKEKVGVIKTYVFMSDDAPAFYNAWAEVMSPVPNKLLCTWHVDKNWRQNLNKISGKQEKRAFVYKSLRVLLQLTSVEQFQSCLQRFMKDLSEDSDTIAFWEYFQRIYSNRPENWAYCYRLRLGLNTNM